MSTHGTESGRRTGWLMISTILIEAWDLYSISFLLIFIKKDFHPSASMLGIGEVVAMAVITVMYLAGIDHSTLWRVGLALGALPALALLLGRLHVPDTALWLIQRGRFRQAKKVSLEMFGDPLDMLPDED